MCIGEILSICPVLINPLKAEGARRGGCQPVAAANEGHLEKLAFCDFFEIAASCNSLDYRELQHRIFKVTSKN